MKQDFSTNKAPEPVGPYPHCKQVGDFIFVSGMGPRRPGTKEIPGTICNEHGKVVEHDVTVQTKSTIENIKVVLEEAGSSLNDVVDVTVFLTHMETDFAKFNEVYKAYFGSIRPTRTTVEVRSLPTPICVELKVIAYKPA